MEGFPEQIILESKGDTGTNQVKCVAPYCGREPETVQQTEIKLAEVWEQRLMGPVWGKRVGQGPDQKLLTCGHRLARDRAAADLVVSSSADSHDGCPLSITVPGTGSCETDICELVNFRSVQGVWQLMEREITCILGGLQSWGKSVFKQRHDLGLLREYSQQR